MWNGQVPKKNYTSPKLAYKKIEKSESSSILKFKFILKKYYKENSGSR